MISYYKLIKLFLFSLRKDVHLNNLWSTESLSILQFSQIPFEAIPTLFLKSLNLADFPWMKSKYCTLFFLLSCLRINGFSLIALVSMCITVLWKNKLLSDFKRRSHVEHIQSLKARNII